MAKDAGADFNYKAVPAEFNGKANEFFDPVYQRALFDEGYRIGRDGGKWMKVPPSRRPS